MIQNYRSIALPIDKALSSPPLQQRSICFVFCLPFNLQENCLILIFIRKCNIYIDILSCYWKASDLATPDRFLSISFIFASLEKRSFESNFHCAKLIQMRRRQIKNAINNNSINWETEVLLKPPYQ